MSIGHTWSKPWSVGESTTTNFKSSEMKTPTTLPKMDKIPTIEDVLKKHLECNPEKVIQHSYLHLVKAAMQEWSSLQNQSLIDRVKELEIENAKLVRELQQADNYDIVDNIISKLNEEIRCQQDLKQFDISQLQQRIFELEKERDELKAAAQEPTETEDDKFKNWLEGMIENFEMEKELHGKKERIQARLSMLKETLENYNRWK